MCEKEKNLHDRQKELRMGLQRTVKLSSRSKAIKLN
jgi:hypothetical protein